MKLLGFFLVNALALLVTANLVPGVEFESYAALVVAAIVIGVINTFVRPLVKLLTLPITFVTLGLFSLVVNAFMFFLAASLTSGFTVDGFIPAFIGSIVMSLVSTFLGMFKK